MEFIAIEIYDIVDLMLGRDTSKGKVFFFIEFSV